MKKLKVMLLILFLVCGICLSACNLSTPPTTPLTVSGGVYFNNVGLEGVKIKSNTRTHFTTNPNGTFSFEEKTSQITIYAEKSGYTFSPKFITLTESTENIVFEAFEIEDLDGTLSLSKINITPTSIVSITDNYLYNQDGNNCLKIKNLFVKIGNNEYDSLNKDFFAIKNKSNTINFLQDLSVDTQQAFSIEFYINVYFTSYRHEYTFTESKSSVLNISAKQTTTMLNDQNQLEYTFVGVNASNNKFSYNITFVFDYYPNI